MADDEPAGVLPPVIRPYRGGDEAALIALWNEALTHDPIDAAAWRTKVLLDPNFQAEGLLIAEAAGSRQGELLGFALSLARQVPLYGEGVEPDRAWITAFGVRPAARRQGIGAALFSAALGRLAASGRRTVLISPYTPNYFIPGVDVDAYPEAVAFLQAAGWETVSRPISMRAGLTGFRAPEAIAELAGRLGREGIAVRPVEAADLPALMPFIIEHFGWDWYRFAQEYLLELFGPGSNEIGLLVATQDGPEGGPGGIIGYCQHCRERFGPFGVAPAWRNRGIGRLLLFRCLAGMRAQGFHCAWFLWTGPDAARLYSLAGFTQVRQFAIMRRALQSNLP